MTATSTPSQIKVPVGCNLMSASQPTCLSIEIVDRMLESGPPAAMLKTMRVCPRGVLPGLSSCQVGLPPLMSHSSSSPLYKQSHTQLSLPLNLSPQFHYSLLHNISHTWGPTTVAWPQAILVTDIHICSKSQLLYFCKDIALSQVLSTGSTLLNPVTMEALLEWTRQDLPWSVFGPVKCHPNPGPWLLLVSLPATCVACVGGQFEYIDWSASGQGPHADCAVPAPTGQQSSRITTQGTLLVTIFGIAWSTYEQHLVTRHTATCDLQSLVIILAWPINTVGTFNTLL